MAALSERLEGLVSIRQRARNDPTGTITRWPNPKLIGIASVKAMILNVAALDEVANWWTSTAEEPSVIPIDRMRSEAIDCRNSQRSFKHFGNIKFACLIILVYFSFHFLSQLSQTIPVKVHAFRNLMGLENDPATEGMDAWGLKRLFSHGFRRWKSGAERPKDISAQTIC